MLVAALLLLTGDHETRTRITVLVFAVAGWWTMAAILYSRVIRPLQTAANMLSAMREGDFSMQAEVIDEEDALGQVMFEINSISAMMRRERLSAIDALTLLNKVIEGIDLGLFTFSEEDRRLKLINRSAEKLVMLEEKDALGKTAEELGLGLLLDSEQKRTVEISFPGKTGRFEIHRATFRERGLPHVLVMVADIGLSLRDEERLAWKRLIRVIGHELNNSLAPIHSLSGTLATLASRDPLPEDWREDMGDGLDVIRSRAAHLSRFMEDYSRIARLPPPRKEQVELGEMIRGVVALETRVPVELVGQGPCTVAADISQLEQVVINLLKNAAEAAQEMDGGVRIACRKEENKISIIIEDDGPGIANPENLFTPFYSTKRGGSGIGLTLSRQIIDAHDGTLSVENRIDATGARATITLPVEP